MSEMKTYKIRGNFFKKLLDKKYLIKYYDFWNLARNNLGDTF